MNSISLDRCATPVRVAAGPARLDYIDATRAFALLLGVLFHASLSFLPTFIGWAVQDVSTSSVVTWFFTVSHSFRMETFFLLAGFLSHMTYHRKGAGRFVSGRSVQVLVPFVVGWFILHPLLISGWSMGAASLRGSYSFFGGLRDGFMTLKQLPNGIFAQTHLWFLYYLALVTGLTLMGRAAVLAIPGASRRLRALVDGGVAWIARSRAGLVTLAAPMIVVLWVQHQWNVNTPDATMRPEVGVLLIYGMFFTFGWLLHRQPHLVAEFARIDVSRVSALLGWVAAVLWLAPYQFDPGNPHAELARGACVVSYVFMMWSLVRLTIGLFHLACGRPRPWVRYLADASYWIYLVHLPIVVWLQVAIADVALPWWLKLPAITGAAVAISLLSYDLFVRSTFIGQVLNGRRRERMVFFRNALPVTPSVRAHTEPVS